MLPTRTRLLVALVLAVGTPLLAQAPIGRPVQSPEPPFADEVLPAEARGRFDPDEPAALERVQHVVPAGPAEAPRSLPGDLADSPVIVPAAASQVVAPAGDLPTPLVTLDVEGSDVSPTGQAVVYKLLVRNVSRAKAHNVVVRVIPPKNADKVKADPPPTSDEAETRWEIKLLEPDQSRTIELAYKPKGDVDEVKIQARVQFDFGRGMITKVSVPTLGVKKDGPEKMVVGDTATYRITVTNSGKVTVKDIEVKEFLNQGLAYEDRELSRGGVDGKLTSMIDPKRGERMWSIPQLAPGQSKTLEYQVKARTAGRVGSDIHVNAPGLAPKQTGFDTEVLTATLTIQAEGPSAGRGTVGQSAGYRILVENKGTADLKNVVVRCTYPPDMRPTRATNGGQPFRDSVQWNFPELKSGETKELALGLATSTPGTRTVQFAVRADKGSEQKTSVPTTFAGVPSLNWDTDVPGTVAAGKAMTYRVTVSNTGTAGARDTQLKVDLPPNVDLVRTTPDAGSGTGPNAKMVIFPKYEIPPGKKTTYLVEVKARQAGEARVVFQLSGEGVGPEAVEHRKMTTVTGTDGRSPVGPPPARVDPSSIGKVMPKPE
jgi:uncharacterized repeat protein (TIGR01451 family)